jgi:hypothetical protein
MNKRYSFGAGAVVAGVGVAALLLGLPGVQADADAGAVAVRATDYAYQGVPGTLPAGEIRISFTNDSQAEAHQMELFRLNDGVTESFEQVLAEDEARAAQLEQQEQAGQEAGPNPPAEPAPLPEPKMTFFGGSGAGPGETARMDLIGNLPAGRYGVVCFLPVASDETGTPHYKKGMKAEFTVQ